ncbi:MAG TPA: HAD-IC family P-type ATPase, partial [Arenibaculum sp.]|nr:HAD-IC family P-type ATPase [Arenibaculum sp.]
GDKVPADLRLLRAKNLQIQESALTGESVPAVKSGTPVPADAPLGDRTCMAYSGTLVTSGQGLGIVTATGAATEIGRIGAMLAGVQTLTTPLLAQMTRFGRWLTAAILILAASTFLFGVSLRDFGAAEMFMAAVGIAVAAIPEGLPAVMTITLAIGVTRMARRNAIIRRLPAVETLGAVTVICSDKTGTLTRNELTVQQVATAGAAYDVGGIGYRPDGEFTLGGQPVDPREVAVLAEILRAGVLCNDASLVERDGTWMVDGDPTDGALLTLGRKAGFDAAAERRLLPRTDLIPFESEHQFMATLHHDHGHGSGHGHGQASRAIVWVKGAPERLLDMADRERRADGEHPLDREAWRRRIHALAARGQRVLGVAVRPIPTGKTELSFADVEEGLVFLGLYGLIDPPRPEAIEAVATCRRAGIQVKMITGDHADTASAIGASFDLGHDHHAVTGREIDALDDDALVTLVSRADVFARTTPEHKLRLVSALQASGATVAMTGDGVNDAPALKRADVGIAMGNKGTEAAKEAGAMVLADDNFASIARAVEEGRTVYDNLRKAILFILPTNAAQAMIVLLAVVLGLALPITPVQILWV